MKELLKTTAKIYGIFMILIMLLIITLCPVWLSILLTCVFSDTRFLFILFGLIITLPMAVSMVFAVMVEG